MASSVPAQVMYPPPPPPSFGSGHSHNPLPPPPHHSSQQSHYGGAPSSSSTSYHLQSVHHPHHAGTLPPPPPPPAHQQHYQGYATQYPSHSGQHHQHTYPQERLPSIRDLDFQFHQQQQSMQAQAQLQQQQNQSQQQQSQQQQHPSQQQAQLQQGASVGASTGGPGAGPGSAVSPASLVITPARQRRAWGPPSSGPGPSGSAAGPSQPQSYTHHHLPPPTQPQSLSHSHSRSQVTSIPSGSASASASSSSAAISASSSFTAGPSSSLPTGQTTQYHTSSPLARRHRSESLISGGGRGSVGSIGSTSSLGGMSAGPPPGSSGGVGQSAGQSGGMSMPSASPVTRSPLVSSAYGHDAGTSAGYAHPPPPPPPAVMGATPMASTSTMSGAGGGGIASSSAAASTSAAGGNPHSPYGTAFPSPHTPHHHLHTPLSQSHAPGPSGSGAGSTAGGVQTYARQDYGEYDYSAGYATPAPTGPPGSAGAPSAQAEQHAYGGRGMSQTQTLYGAPPQSHPSHHPPPPNQEPWSTPHPHQQSPLVGYHQSQQGGHHIPQQQQQQHQHQHAAYARSSGSSSSLVGAVGGGYGTAPPPPSHQSTHPHPQTHGHGQIVSPGAGEHETSHGSGPIGGGGLPLGVAGGSAGGSFPPGSAKAHFLPKVRELCYMLHEFAARYANSTTQPSQAEVEDMARKAAEVIHLLSEYKRAALAEGSVAGPSLHHPHPYAHQHAYSHSYPGVGMGLPSPAPEDHETDRDRGGTRPPKRPWEDVAQESDEEGFMPSSLSAPVPKFGGASKRDSASKTESISTGPMISGGPLLSGRGLETDKERSAAEKDMALIRSKRATNVASLGPGAPKGKYRKRSRATPPGKCHSCNIRETPEWRRGPDGARTLCNACGLHYAKLIRKRDKQAAANTDGSQPRIEIDMETLRASTRAASEREQMKAERERERRERERTGVIEKLEDLSGGGGGLGEQGGIGLELGLGLGLETGSNGGISSGNEAGDNPTGADLIAVTGAKGNGNENANSVGGIITAPPPPVAISSNGSNSSVDLMESWQAYTDADIGQTSSFLRGPDTAAGVIQTAVRPSSS